MHLLFSMKHLLIHDIMALTGGLHSHPWKANTHKKKSNGLNEWTFYLFIFLTVIPCCICWSLWNSVWLEDICLYFVLPSKHRWFSLRTCWDKSLAWTLISPQSNVSFTFPSPLWQHAILPVFLFFNAHHVLLVFFLFFFSQKKGSAEPWTC